MILPFSRSRSRTSLSSNCLYCASFTPRAMFSKSMNIASFRSPFIPTVLSPSGRLYGATPSARKLLRALYSDRDGETEGRSGARGARASRPDPHGQVACPHLRPHAAIRSRALDVSLPRSGGARDVVDLAGVSPAAEGHHHLGHPLRHPLVEARQRLGRRPDPGDPRSDQAAARGRLRASARRSGLHHQHLARRSCAGRRHPGAQARGPRPRARPRRAAAAGPAQALLLEELEVAPRPRVHRRQPARVLGAERLPHARRPVGRGALLRPGDAGDATDARRSGAPSARSLARSPPRQPARNSASSVWKTTGWSPGTVWPAPETSAKRAFGFSSSIRLAISADRTSESPPRTSKIGQAIARHSGHRSIGSRHVPARTASRSPRSYFQVRPPSTGLVPCSTRWRSIASVKSGFVSRWKASACSRLANSSGERAISVPTRSIPAAEISGPMSTITSRSTLAVACPANAIATRPPIDSPTIERCESPSASVNAATSDDSVA